MNADQNQTSQVTLENIEALAQLGYEDNWSSGDDGNDNTYDDKSEGEQQ